VPRPGKASYEIVLHLDDMRYLFVEPPFDPFSPKGIETSGIDQIKTFLKPKSLTKRTRTTVYLPKDKIEVDLEHRTKVAIVRYCKRKIAEYRSELSSLRWQGLKALQSGFLFLVVCLALSTFFDGLDTLPTLVRRVGGEGFLIAGWVALFHPIEILIYEWWPYHRQIQIYENVMNMDVEIETEDARDSAQ
jgi:hypothetical protein